jgi:hypothetical protein
MARGLPARMPCRWGDRRSLHDQELAALTRRLRTHMARALAARQDPRLDRPAMGLRRQLPGHVHASWKAVGAT